MKESLVSEPLRPLFSTADEGTRPVESEFQAAGEPLQKSLLLLVMPIGLLHGAAPCVD